MTEEEQDKVTVELKDDDSRIVEKSYDELDPKLQDEGYGGECDDEENENENNELESRAAEALNLSKSKDRWLAFLEDVKPVAPILLDKFPSMALRYKLIINELKAVTRDLPSSKDLLLTYIKICKLTMKSLHKQKKNKLWDNYSSSMQFIQLENSLKLLHSNMQSIAIELKLDLSVTRTGGRRIPKDLKKADNENPNNSVDKESEDKVDESQNRWIGILKEVQPVAPILLRRFQYQSDGYVSTIERCMEIIKTLPDSAHQLPVCIKMCKKQFRWLQKGMKKGDWDDYKNLTVELQQLQNSLNFLFSKMVSIAIELNIDLVDKVQK